MRVHRVWLFFFLLLTVAAFFFYRTHQASLTYEFAEAFDGNDYRMAYDYFLGQAKSYEVPPPFHQRIVVPFVASWFGRGIINDFQVVNLIFSILAIWIIFLLWRRLGIEFKWMMLGFIWLLFHWSGMIRLNAFDPITVDVPLYLFQALLLFFLFKRKFNALLWLVPLATAQKESFIGYMVVLMAYAWWHNKKANDGYFNLKPIVFATFLGIVTKLAIGYFFPAAAAGRGPLIMIAYQAKQLLDQPFELIRWLAAISMAFGPLLWITTRNYIKTTSWDVKRNLLVLFSGLSLAYALLAGGDMTRIAYLGFPFVMTWIVFESQRAELKNFYLIALLSLPLMMLQQAIPDPAFQWDLWQQWYPEFASSEIVLLILGYVISSSLILMYAAKRKVG